MDEEMISGGSDTSDTSDTSDAGVAGSRLEGEYDATFSGDERVNNLLKITSDAFTREKRLIKTRSIGLSEPIKAGRRETLAGLTASVKDLGVMVPVHVMTLEEADDDFAYVLLDGARRVYAALRNGQEEIEAVVWDFKDKELGSDMALVLSLILNRSQRRRWMEIWNLYQTLELQMEITPGTLEYLLQLEAGDAVKLKDVMSCRYPEIIQDLLDGKKTLEQSYKALQKARKENDEGGIAEQDATSLNDRMDDASEVVGNNEEEGLTDEQVQNLLEMVDDLDSLDDAGEEDFFDNPDAAFVDAQVVGDRHPLDPALRQAVLARDKFTCACCGLKMIGARLGLIAVHHKIPVHCHGKDVMENLITLCVNCHLSLHIMERNGGQILMSNADWYEMSARDEDGDILCKDADGNVVKGPATVEEARDLGYKPVLTNDQTSLRKALEFAKLAIKADKLQGMSKQQVVEATSDAIRHPMPGAGMKENRAAYVATRGRSNEGSANGGD